MSAAAFSRLVADELGDLPTSLFAWVGRRGALQVRRPWLLRARTPETCEACQKGWKVQIFRPRTDVVPYRATKSSCGRRKILNTAGHACPNPARTYFAVTNETLHGVVGNGKRSQRQDIQDWKCHACGQKFTSRLHTPLYRLKTDPEKVTLVLMLLANGCDLSGLVRCTPHAEATVTRWLARMGRHSQRLHGRFFQKLVFPLLPLDELHARVRREGVQWVWVALDPVTKVLPTLYLGPRTTEAAMQFVHQVAQVLTPNCLPAFTADGLRAYFYALTAHFGQWMQEPGQRKAHWQVSPDLLHGQLVERKCQAQFAENLGLCPNGGASPLTPRMVAGVLPLCTASRKFGQESSRAGSPTTPEPGDGGRVDGQVLDGEGTSLPAALARLGLK